MMAFAEIFACFQERICGGSGGAHNPPLGHMTGYTVCAVKALQAGMDPDEIGRAIVNDRSTDVVSPYPAAFSIYAVAKKAAELHNGPVTRRVNGRHASLCDPPDLPEGGPHLRRPGTGKKAGPDCKGIG